MDRYALLLLNTLAPLLGNLCPICDERWCHAGAPHIIYCAQKGKEESRQSIHTPGSPSLKAKRQGCQRSTAGSQSTGQGGQTATLASGRTCLLHTPACTKENTEQAVMCRMMQRVHRAGNCSTPMFLTRMQPIMATISGCWMRLVSLREALRDVGLEHHTPLPEAQHSFSVQV